MQNPIAGRIMWYTTLLANMELVMSFFRKLRLCKFSPASTETFWTPNFTLSVRCPCSKALRYRLPGNLCAFLENRQWTLICSCELRPQPQELDNSRQLPHLTSRRTENGIIKKKSGKWLRGSYFSSFLCLQMKWGKPIALNGAIWTALYLKYCPLGQYMNWIMLYEHCSMFYVYF